MELKDLERLARRRAGMIRNWNGLGRLVHATCRDFLSSTGQSLRLMLAELRKLG